MVLCQGSYFCFPYFSAITGKERKERKQTATCVNVWTVLICYYYRKYGPGSNYNEAQIRIKTTAVFSLPCPPPMETASSKEEQITVFSSVRAQSSFASVSWQAVQVKNANEGTEPANSLAVPHPLFPPIHPLTSHHLWPLVPQGDAMEPRGKNKYVGLTY